MDKWILTSHYDSLINNKLLLLNPTAVKRLLKVARENFSTSSRGNMENLPLGSRSRINIPKSQNKSERKNSRLTFFKLRSRRSRWRVSDVIMNENSFPFYLSVRITTVELLLLTQLHGGTGIHCLAHWKFKLSIFFLRECGLLISRVNKLIMTKWRAFNFNGKIMQEFLTLILNYEIQRTMFQQFLRKLAVLYF